MVFMGCGICGQEAHTADVGLGLNLCDQCLQKHMDALDIKAIRLAIAEYDENMGGGPMGAYEERCTLEGLVFKLVKAMGLAKSWK